MKELDLGLSKGLLDSVSGVLKDSSKVKAEAAKTTNEQLSSQYTKMAARPLSTEEAKVNTYASKAPERRVNDAINAVYAKSVAESAAQQKAESEAIQRAYAARGAAKPVTESVDEAKALHPNQKKIDANKNGKIDAHDFEVLRSRKSKMQADVADETILNGEKIEEATPSKNTDVSDKSWLKTAGKKPGPLHNVGKGLKAFIKGKKEPMESVEVEGEQLDEISIDTMKSAKEKLGNKAFQSHMDDNKYAAQHYAGRAMNMKKKIAQKEKQLAKEEVEQIDELKAKTLASYINKAKHSIASDAYRMGAGQEEDKTANKFANRLVGINKATKSLVKKIKEDTEPTELDEKLTLDKDGKVIGGGNVMDTIKDKQNLKFGKPRVKPEDKEDKEEKEVKEENELEEATHILSGATDFMKKHAKAALDKVGAKISKITHDEDSGTSEYHVSHDQRDRVIHASKELEKRGKESYGGLYTEGFAEMDAWLKKRKEQEGTGKFEKKKISTGTVYTKKPEKEKVEENVTLSSEELARIEELSKQFDSKE